jgi:hypothetical protein
MILTAMISPQSGGARNAAAPTTSIPGSPISLETAAIQIADNATALRQGGSSAHWPLRRKPFLLPKTEQPAHGKLKEFKRIAMRSDKTDSSLEAMIYLATAVIHSR